MDSLDKVSVFGGTGFIGSRFCELFSGDIVIVDRDSNESPTGNVLYLISTTHNYNVFDNPHLDIDTNLSKLIDVLENFRKKYENDKNAVFNFVSSWFVYGKTENIPVLESQYCNPKGFYSITKRAAEQLLESYCETFELKYRIFRLGNVYGPKFTEYSKKRNALQFLINEIINERDINLYDDGSNIRDFIHVDDVCRAFYHLLGKCDVNCSINIGTGNSHTFREIMEYVKKKVMDRDFSKLNPNRIRM